MDKVSKITEELYFEIFLLKKLNFCSLKIIRVNRRNKIPFTKDHESLRTARLCCSVNLVEMILNCFI